MGTLSTHIKTIITYFCLIFTFSTVMNDFFTFLDFDGYYMSNRSKYIASAVLSFLLYVFISKKRHEIKSQVN